MKDALPIAWVLFLAALMFAQGIPLARKPEESLRWLRSLPAPIKFFLRNNPEKMTFGDAEYGGIASIVIGVVLVLVAIAMASYSIISALTH